MGSVWRLVRDGLAAVLALTEAGIFHLQGVSPWVGGWVDRSIPKQPTSAHTES